MKVSYKWLRDYIDLDLEPGVLADKLTMSGTEVASIEKASTQGLERVVVGRIISLKRHPNADKLSVCEVTDGERTLPIVCGADNMKAGDKVALAYVGAELPNGVKLKKAKIRGEVSEGMMCSEAELHVGPDAEGIIILPPDAPVGRGFAAYRGLEDYIIDIEVTPNRPDCLSVIGLAREIAALTGQRVRYPEVRVEEDDERLEDYASAEVKDLDLCPRYSMRLIRDLTIAPSPQWMVERLEAAGQRSISNMVDITNFVMLELGQPLHAFDYDTLAEHRIIVQRSRPGETFVTLDGKEHALDGETCMISDAAEHVGIGGIMGGRNSEITESTRHILLESAHFNPLSIRRSARRLNISSEAAYRFMRGVDPNGTMFAANRAAELMAQLGKGRVLAGSIDIYPRKIEPRRLELPMSLAKRVLGIGFEAGEAAELLGGIELETEAAGNGLVRVSCPTFRPDLERPVDLVEELGRLKGFDQIPDTLPAGRLRSEPRDAVEVHGRRAGEFLADLGCFEVINLSFINSRRLDEMGLAPDHPWRRTVRLRNPLSEEQEVMRPSLLPGLLATARRNLNHRNENLKLFELGRVYFRTGNGELPREVVSLAGLMLGRRQEVAWFAEAALVDYYDVKGLLEALGERLGAPEPGFRAGVEGYPFLDPERAAVLEVSGKEIGYLGALNSPLRARLELPPETQAFELDFQALVAHLEGGRSFRELPSHPPVELDLAITLPEEVTFKAVFDTIRGFDRNLISEVTLFDLYRGAQVPPGKKSLAFRIVLQHPKRTLLGRDVKMWHEGLTRKLRESLDAELRA